MVRINLLLTEIPKEEKAATRNSEDGQDEEQVSNQKQQNG